MFSHARDMAAKSLPEEAVGVLSGGDYIGCQNIARSPDKSFRLDYLTLIKHHPVDAIVHSHPGGIACPSAHDMQQQLASGLPWLISVIATASKPDIAEEWFSWGHTPRLDAMSGYRHGVTDCYGLIRGWFHDEHGIILPDYPRQWEWWQGHDNLYLSHFADAGFAVLPPQQEFQRGDVFLAAIRSSVPNHAGIYWGDGLIFHHLAGAKPVDASRLARKEPIERWKRYITTWLRHQQTV